MEIAVVNPQAVLQMYQCKDYPWHSVATSPVADKETIIANADFTITSAIARRRLSSKKRRKEADSSGSGRISSDGSATSSPTSSLESLIRHPSPAAALTSTTTLSTPPAMDSSSSVVHRPVSDFPNSSHPSSLPSSQPPSHVHTHRVVPSYPRATLGPHESGPAIVPTVTPYHFAPTLSVGSTGTEHRAFTHPMYSHLQQELNYRYLQDQSDSGSVWHGNGHPAAFSAPHSQPLQQAPQSSVVGSSATTTSSSVEGGRRQHRIKWCSAHITIAKQIQAHQQQAKTVRELAGVMTESGVGARPSNHPATVDAAAQQIAMLQMYGVPTHPVPPGYVAMPGVSYPTMPEVQLHNLSFVPHTAPTALFMDATNMLSVKPVPGVTSQASETANLNVQMMNGVQLLPYTQSLPVATVMPGGGGVSNAAMNGSYIGPVPVPVIGNCVLNPCRPGVMAAPWVR